MSSSSPSKDTWVVRTCLPEPSMYERALLWAAISRIRAREGDDQGSLRAMFMYHECMETKAIMSTRRRPLAVSEEW